MARKRRKIGIDYDDVIANTGEVKAKLIEEKFGRVLPPWKTDRTNCVRLIGKDNYETISNAVYDRPLTMSAPQVPGAFFALYSISQRADIYVVTARPPTRVNYARNWLRKIDAIEFIKEFRSIYADNGEKVTKGQICSELGLDAFIDDEERFLQQIDSKLLRILLKNACPEDLPITKGIKIARSWEEVLDLLGYKR